MEPATKPVNIWFLLIACWGPPILGFVNFVAALRTNRFNPVGLTTLCGALVTILFALLVKEALRRPAPLLLLAAWASPIVTVLGFYVMAAIDRQIRRHYLANASINDITLFDNRFLPLAIGSVCAAGFACGLLGLLGTKRHGPLVALLPAVSGLLLSGSIGLILFLLLSVTID